MRYLNPTPYKVLLYFCFYVVFYFFCFVFNLPQSHVTHARARAHTHTHTHTHTPRTLGTPLGMCACVNVCVCVHVCMCAHMYCVCDTHARVWCLWGLCTGGGENRSAGMVEPELMQTLNHKQICGALVEPELIQVPTLT